MFANQERYLHFLDERIAPLAAAVARSDEMESWGHMLDVLAWLYRAREAARNDLGERSYVTVSTADLGGQTLEALVWARARVEHHQAEVVQQIWRRAQTMVWDGAKWVPARMKVWVGSEWVEAERRVWATGWPDRGQLPAGRPERHGRDVLYDRLVAGRDPVAPIRDAYAFLKGL